MTRILSCALAAILVLAACGKESPPAESGPQAEATAPGAESAAVAESKPAVPADEAPEAPGSSDGESIDETTSVTSPIAAAIAANTPAPPSGDLQRWKAGENFLVYPVAQPVSTPPGGVEVIEGFWYGCGFCFRLEPYLEAWEKNKPEWVTVRRLPVIWNEVTREDARLFFTIEGLGLQDKLHSEVFRQIHAKGKPITVISRNRVDPAATEKAAREFLVSHGVTPEEFARHYRTFSTEHKLRQAENLSRSYRLEHTPMMVVHGKYLTDVDMAGGMEQLFQLVNDLAARERGPN